MAKNFIILFGTGIIDDFEFFANSIIMLAIATTETGSMLIYKEHFDTGSSVCCPETFTFHRFMVIPVLVLVPITKTSYQFICWSIFSSEIID
jgi:hypothetical protein